MAMETYDLTEDQMREYKEAFEAIDEDGNGSITAEELGRVMK